MTKLLRIRTVRIAIDVVLFIGFISEFLTREGPDYDLHSWIGIVLIPIVGIHLTTNWSWIKSTWRRRSSHPEWPLARFNALFMATTVVCIATGFPLWLEWSSSAAWSVSHQVTGLLATVQTLSHVWRNRRHIGRLVRRS